ncbi:MAG: dTDP-4-dehydrorhamnose reductase [Hydrogenovibrio sp.]
MTKVLVTGSNGQLGQSLQSIQSQFPDLSFVFLDRSQLDLSQLDAIQTVLSGYEFDVLINCAAYTAVDQAESENELADKINHQAVKELAKATKRQAAKIIHISTDYVFNGRAYKPYQETDKTDPQNVYGFTKWQGEQALLNHRPENAIVIRTSWVYSEFGHNFVKTMLRLGKERENLNVIFDQVGSPTYAKDLANAILQIVMHPTFQKPTITSQIFHYANEGVCSWFDFAKAIFELSKYSCQVSPIETKDYPTPAVRPHYSVMNQTKIKRFYGLEIPYWRDALKNGLKELEK